MHKIFKGLIGVKSIRDSLFLSLHKKLHGYKYCILAEIQIFSSLLQNSRVILLPLFHVLSMVCIISIASCGQFSHKFGNGFPNVHMKKAIIILNKCNWMVRDSSV